MDDLINEFVTETMENLALLDQELVKFEQEPSEKEILSNIFRMMHTIKGTCGFLGLSRLEKVAHAGEDVLGKFRDGELEPTPQSVTLILKCIDQIRNIVEVLSETGGEGDGDDSDLIARLRELASGEAPKPKAAASEPAPAAGGPQLSPEGFPVAAELLEEFEQAVGKGADKKDAQDKGGGPQLSPEGFPVAAELLEEFEQAVGKKAAAPAPEPAKKTAPAAAKPAAKAPTTAAKAETKEAKTDTPKADGPKEKAAPQSIRVSVDVLENLMTLVSEMVLTRNQLLQMARGSDASAFKEPIERLSRTTSELQEGVMKTRMQPIGNAWSKLPRIVRDLANELGKKINLEMKGEETELDRQVLEMIQDPLTHMVRNSADHGIELPDQRAEAGKEPGGTIKLSAMHEGGHIIVEITDDGRGINTARIREKIVERGMATAEEVDAMDDHQVNQYIMRAGFSTAEKVTKVSGRGVGMDVVRSNIEKIGGKIEFRSVYGKGSTFTIKIPLTLAIVSSLIVTSGNERFALPQIAVHEVVRISERSENQIDDLKGAPILRLRDKLLPLVNLNELLNLDSGEGSWRPGHNAFEGYVVVCRNGSQDMGIIVDSIADTEEIVVKPLSPLLGTSKHFSGNTILGDGRVVLILDLNGLSSSLSQEAVQAQADEAPVEQVRADGQSILLFKTMREGIKAVPLSQVQRIENFDMASTEAVQGELVIQYRSGLLPLVSFDGDAGIRREGHQQVLVFVSGARAVGLAIDSIVDIAHDTIKLGKPAREPGIVGSGIIAGRAADVVDPEYFFSMIPETDNAFSLSEVA